MAKPSAQLRKDVRRTLGNQAAHAEAGLLRADRNRKRASKAERPSKKLRQATNKYYNSDSEGGGGGGGSGPGLFDNPIGFVGNASKNFAGKALEALDVPRAVAFNSVWTAGANLGNELRPLVGKEKLDLKAKGLDFGSLDNAIAERRGSIEGLVRAGAINPEGMSSTERLLLGIAGFAVDTATDPLAYATVGVGPATKVVGRAAAEIADIKTAQRAITSVDDAARLSARLNELEGIVAKGARAKTAAVYTKEEMQGLGMRGGYQYLGKEIGGQNLRNAIYRHNPLSKARVVTGDKLDQWHLAAKPVLGKLRRGRMGPARAVAREGGRRGFVGEMTRRGEVVGSQHSQSLEQLLVHEKNRIFKDFTPDEQVEAFYSLQSAERRAADPEFAKRLEPLREYYDDLHETYSQEVGRDMPHLDEYVPRQITEEMRATVKKGKKADGSLGKVVADFAKRRKIGPEFDAAGNPTGAEITSIFGQKIPDGLDPAEVIEFANRIARDPSNIGADMYRTDLSKITDSYIRQLSNAAGIARRDRWLYDRGIIVDHPKEMIEKLPNPERLEKMGQQVQRGRERLQQAEENVRAIDGTKAVDEIGQPVRVHQVEGRDGQLRFTEADKGDGDPGAFLDLRNPYVVGIMPEDATEIAAIAATQRYDGILAYGDDGRNFIVFDQAQVHNTPENLLSSTARAREEVGQVAAAREALTALEGKRAATEALSPGYVKPTSGEPGPEDFAQAERADASLGTVDEGVLPTAGTQQVREPTVPTDYSIMGVRKLRTEAKAAGIKGADRMPKKTLVTRLEARSNTADALEGVVKPTTDVAQKGSVVSPSLGVPDQGELQMQYLANVVEGQAFSAEQAAQLEELDELIGGVDNFISSMEKPMIGPGTATKIVNSSDNSVRRMVKFAEKDPDRARSYMLAADHYENASQIAREAQGLSDPAAVQLGTIEAQREQLYGQLAEQQVRLDAVETKAWKYSEPKYKEKFIKDVGDAAKVMIGDQKALMDPDAAEVLTKVRNMGMGRDSEEWSKFFKHYDQAVNWLKAYQIATPGFHTRNAIGGMFNNFLAGVDLGSYMDFIKADRAFSGGKWDAFAAKNADIAERYVEARNAVGWGQIGSEFTEAQGPSSWFKPTTRWKGIRLSRRAGENTERFLRVTLAMDSLKKGGSLDEAVDMVHTFHFDYNDLSDFERKLKRVVPFYTWTRNNLPLQMEMLMKRPNVYAAWEHFTKNISYGLEAPNLVPGYYGEIGAFQTPFSEDGESIFGTSAVLPLGDLNDPLDPGKYMSMVTPYIKTPIELYQDKQFFKGLPLTGRDVELPGAYKVIPGLVPALVATGMINKKGLIREDALYVIEQFSPLMARTARLATPDERNQEREYTNWINFFFNLGLRTNTKTEQKSERFRRSLKNKKPVTIYVNK